jgi:hypothetical protein
LSRTTAQLRSPWRLGTLPVRCAWCPHDPSHPPTRAGTRRPSSRGGQPSVVARSCRSSPQLPNARCSWTSAPCRRRRRVPSSQPSPPHRTAHAVPVAQLHPAPDATMQVDPVRHPLSAVQAGSAHEKVSAQTAPPPRRWKQMHPASPGPQAVSSPPHRLALAGQLASKLTHRPAAQTCPPPQSCRSWRGSALHLPFFFRRHAPHRFLRAWVRSPPTRSSIAATAAPAAVPTRRRVQAVKREASTARPFPARTRPRYAHDRGVTRSCQSL